MIMFFRLTNTPVAFMDLMNRVFKECLDMFIIVFIGGILIYIWNEDKHANHLRIVLQILKDHQLFAMFIKCKFWLRSVPFLYHVVLGDDIKINPQKIEAVKNSLDLLLPQT